MRSEDRSRRRERFKGWRCDSCGDIISSVESGWLEWLASEDKHGNDVLRGLRLVHCGRQENAQSRNCRYDPREEFRCNNTIVEGLPLNRLVGPDGLMVLLALIAEAELPHAEILELVRRVQIPGYELIRNRSLTEQQSTLLVPVLGHRCYLQSEIREMLVSST